jgi:hypothetical protein
MRESRWMWVVGAVLFVLAGCGVMEGLRQSAYVERARAEQQQRRSQDLNAILGVCQDATSLVEQVVKDSPELVNVLGQLQAAHEMAVEKAAEIEIAATKSENWQRADAATVGTPKNPILPDTAAEDAALSTFISRAETIEKLRAIAGGLGSAIGDMKRNMRAPPAPASEGTSTTALIYGGGALASLLAGGGIAKLLKKVSTLATVVSSLPDHSRTQELEATKAEMKRRQDRTEEQVLALQSATEDLRKLMAQQKVPATT